MFCIQSFATVGHSGLVSTPFLQVADWLNHWLTCWMLSHKCCRWKVSDRDVFSCAVWARQILRTYSHSTLHYITVQYSTIQYSTIQYSTVQYSTVQYSTCSHSQSRDIGMASLLCGSVCAPAKQFLAFLFWFQITSHKFKLLFDILVLVIFKQRHKNKVVS